MYGPRPYRRNPSECSACGTSSHGAYDCEDCGQRVEGFCRICDGDDPQIRHRLCSDCWYLLERERNADRYAAAEMGPTVEEDWRERQNGCHGCHDRQNPLKPHEAEAILDQYVPGWREDQKTAYRQAVRKYHPDVNPGAGQILANINAAMDLMAEGRRRVSEKPQSTPFTSPVLKNYGDAPPPIQSIWFSRSKSIFFAVLQAKRRKHMGVFLATDAQANLIDAMLVILPSPLPPPGDWAEIRWSEVPPNTADQIVWQLRPTKKRTAKPQKTQAPKRRRRRSYEGFGD